MITKSPKQISISDSGRPVFLHNDYTDFWVLRKLLSGSYYASDLGYNWGILIENGNAMWVVFTIWGFQWLVTKDNSGAVIGHVSSVQPRMPLGLFNMMPATDIPPESVGNRITLPADFLMLFNPAVAWQLSPQRPYLITETYVGWARFDVGIDSEIWLDAGGDPLAWHINSIDCTGSTAFIGIPWEWNFYDGWWGLMQIEKIEGIDTLTNPTPGTCTSTSGGGDFPPVA